MDSDAREAPPAERLHFRLHAARAPTEQHGKTHLRASARPDLKRWGHRRGPKGHMSSLQGGPTVPPSSYELGCEHRGGPFRRRQEAAWMVSKTFNARRKPKTEKKLPCVSSLPYQKKPIPPKKKRQKPKRNGVGDDVDKNKKNLGWCVVGAEIGFSVKPTCSRASVAARLTDEDERVSSNDASFVQCPALRGAI